MGSKGSSSAVSTSNAQSLFQTVEGWREYCRRVELLHNMPTDGQRQAIINEIHQQENGHLSGLINAQEYQDIMKANELYEKLINEGNENDE